ncbi:uncharacterized protein LOC119689256 [Teleopsis dalmanni]|uniref:uncharacterized protein LOC119689256 n=1 Tax=Teleopsis dalmanni TaxID=139649 RepID=UPI0018CDC3DF|nr:uncharacterized protein LOC119689256 [Teleopsis dalmanni]XP_037959977.1 uncharacterized protein LOC119689256 [Teleopsis dalmanni]
MELPTGKTVLCLLRFRKRLNTAEIIKYGLAYCNNGNTTKAQILEGISCLVSMGLVKRITANKNKKEPFEECKEDDDAEYELTGTSKYKWLESDATSEEETETTLSKLKQKDLNSLLSIKKEKDMVYVDCQQHVENYLMTNTHALVDDSKLRNISPDESKQEEAALFNESKQDHTVSLDASKQAKTISLDGSKQEEPISLDESQQEDPVSLDESNTAGSTIINMIKDHALMMTTLFKRESSEKISEKVINQSVKEKRQHISEVEENNISVKSDNIATDMCNDDFKKYVLDSEDNTKAYAVVQSKQTKVPLDKKPEKKKKKKIKQVIGKKIKYHSKKKKLLVAKTPLQKRCINGDIKDVKGVKGVKGINKDLCCKKLERKIKGAVRGKNNRVHPLPKKMAMERNTQQERIIENFRAVMKKGKQIVNAKKRLPKKKPNAKCQQNKCVMKMCNHCKKVKVYIKKVYGTGKIQTYRVRLGDEINAEDMKTNEIYNRLFGDTKLDPKPINKRKLGKKIKNKVNLRKRPHVMCNENDVMKIVKELRVHCNTPEDGIYLQSVPVPKKKKLC